MSSLDNIADHDKPTKETSKVWGCVILFGVMLVASIIIPSFVRTPDSARNLVLCEVNLNNIGMALEMYATEHEGKYPESLGELSPDYLTEIPQCPSYFQGSYHLQIGPNNLGNVKKEDNYFLLSCVGSNHLEVLSYKDYPKFNRDAGVMKDPSEMPK